MASSRHIVIPTKALVDYTRRTDKPRHTSVLINKHIRHSDRTVPVLSRKRIGSALKMDLGTVRSELSDCATI